MVQAKIVFLMFHRGQTGQYLLVDQITIVFLQQELTSYHFTLC